MGFGRRISVLFFLQLSSHFIGQSTTLNASSKKVEHSHHIPHRIQSQDNSVHNLGWKIVGYIMLIIPAYFLIKMIRTSNFYEREGEGFSYNLIKCCIFGSSKGEGESRKIFNCFTGTSTRSTALKLTLCVAGIQCSFLTWGVLQEKVMTTVYTNEQQSGKFTNSEFIVFMNRIVALVLSATYIYTTGANWSGPFYHYSFCSLSNICSSWCQYEALKFVSFPTQVVVKTSKMIPVMIMGRFVLRKSYAYFEYVLALLISVGVSLFLLSASSDTKHTSAVTTVPGLLLMLGYMVFDSFTSNWQSRLYAEHKVSSMQMMFNLNVFSSILTLMPLVISGGLVYSISFARTFPGFASHVLIMSVSSAVGQVFLYFTIAEFGPLVFTTVMVTRQMMSILLSCIIYGHTLGAQALAGAFIVFVTLFFNAYAKHRIRVKQMERQANSGGERAVNVV